jgi:hypothetical protein
MKLLGRETNESIMMSEETLPAATPSLLHMTTTATWLLGYSKAK